MQTCSRCFTQSSDTVLVCPKCQADLKALSTTAVALAKFRANPRVLWVHLAMPEDACPVCRAVEGTYPKEKAPNLPIEGCSEPNGCRGFYQPLLEEIYP
jgi:hypothetical protein